MDDGRTRIETPDQSGWTRSPFRDTVSTGVDDQFRLLVDVVQDYAIFMLDPTGRIRSWNMGAGEAAAGLRASLLLPILALPVAAVVAGGTVLAVRCGFWSGWGRVHYALVAVASIVFLLQLQYWNLLGWHF